MQPALILASSSPRRQAILKSLRVHFHLVSADIDESVKLHEQPQNYVSRIALEKARKVFQQQLFSGIPILAADTSVILQERILGKPTDIQDAFAMLSALSNNTHRVLTAIAMVTNNKQQVSISETKVTFAKLSDADIWQYIKTGEPMDKAGAYGIQGWGSLFIKKIVGSYSGVMGLPIYDTAQLLKAFNIDILHAEA